MAYPVLVSHQDGQLIKIRSFKLVFISDEDGINLRERVHLVLLVQDIRIWNVSKIIYHYGL